MGYGKWVMGKVKRKMEPSDFGKIEWDCFGDWEMELGIGIWVK